MRFVLLLLLVLGATNPCLMAQKSRHVYPVGTFHQKNVIIDGISVGLASSAVPKHNQTNGLKIELIGLGLFTLMMPQSPIAKDPADYRQRMKDTLGERVNGVVLSPLGSISDCAINGLSIGGYGQISRSVRGGYISGFCSWTQCIQGLQASGWINETFELRGAQVAIFYNGSYDAKGAQIGLWNKSRKMRGVQIGLYNQTKQLQGIQIGLLNRSEWGTYPIVAMRLRK
jgi:hypothetical protein